MTKKPTIVLVHGFWGGAAHWSGVIIELSRRGYTDIRAVENPLTSLADDAERTRKMIAQIDGPVVLVGHSYGGAVITEAGNQPNVTGLVFVAAFAPDAGESPAQLTEQFPPEGASALVPDSDGYLWIDPEKFRSNFAQDVSANDALVMAVTQKAPLASTFGDQVSDPAWRHKPSWYPVSTEDKMIHPDNERATAQRMSPQQTIELDASHASLASQPAAIADLIEAAATA